MGRKLVAAMKDKLGKQLFEVVIQAAANGDIVARETIKVGCLQASSLSIFAIASVVGRDGTWLRGSGPLQLQHGTELSSLSEPTSAAQSRRRFLESQYSLAVVNII